MSEFIAIFALGFLTGALVALFGVLLAANISTSRQLKAGIKSDQHALDAFHEKRPGQRLRAIDGGTVSTIGRHGRRINPDPPNVLFKPPAPPNPPLPRRGA